MADSSTLDPKIFTIDTLSDPKSLQIYSDIISEADTYTFKVSDAWGKCEKISEIKNTSIFFLQGLATLSIKTIAT